MSANGAKPKEVEGFGKTFDDPGLEAQSKCRAELAAAENYGNDAEFRIATLAAEALKDEINRCISREVGEEATTVPDTVFNSCVAKGRSAIGS